MLLAHWLGNLLNWPSKIRSPRRRKGFRNPESLEDRTLLSPIFSLEVTHDTTVEGTPNGPADNAVFRIINTGDYASPIGVFVTITGTATFNEDYAGLSGYVNAEGMLNLYYSGSEPISYYVTGLPDSLVEGTETVHIQLEPHYSYGLGSNTAIDLYVVDNSTRVTVSATDSTATEGGINGVPDPGTFTFTRTGGDLNQYLTVGYSISGTAINGSDYQQLYSMVTFAPGQTTATINVTPQDDAEVEDTETVQVTVSAGSGYVVGSPSSAIVEIADDDEPPDAYVTGVTVTKIGADAEEDNSAGGVKAQTIRISRSDTNESLTVYYSITGSATAGVDYANLPAGSVVIPDGQDHVDLVVTPVWDTDDTEGDETVTLTLALDPNDSSRYHLDQSTDDTTVIIHDAVLPIVTLYALDPTGIEMTASGEPDKAHLQVLVSRAAQRCSYPIVVYFSASGLSTASALTDYTMFSPITIPGSATSGVIEITPAWDKVEEPDESVIVELDPVNPGATYKLGTTTTATAWIQDTTISTISLSVSSSNAAEEGPGDGDPVPGQFMLHRVGNLSVPVTVYLARGGTATVNTDYTWDGSPITFPANQSDFLVNILPIWDTLIEGSETVYLQVSDGIGYLVDEEQNEGEITIADAPQPVISVVATDPDAAEDNGNGAADPGTWTIYRTGGTSQPLTISYQLSGTATKGVDYTTTPSLDPSGTIVIPAHQSSITIQLAPEWNQDLESFETAKLTIVDTASYAVSEEQSEAEIGITDAPLPLVWVEATDAVAAEQDGPELTPDPGTFTVYRTGNLTKALTVSFNLQGTASPQDYTLSPTWTTWVEIPAGASSASITLTPIQDDVFAEGAETRRLILRTGTYYTIAEPSEATITIYDAPAPVVTIFANDADAKEDGANGVPESGSFLLTRTGSTAAALTVTYSVFGTATPGADYTALTGSVVFAVGSATATLVVNPKQDNLNSEGTETVTVTLTPNTQYVLSGETSAQVLIADSPLPTVQIQSPDSQAAEPVPGIIDTGTVIVTRTGRLNQSLTVQLSLSGTASSSTDYTTTPTSSGGTISITFGPGQDSKTITLTPLEDSNYQEGTEQAIIKLGQSSNYSISGSDQVTVSIADGPPLPTIEIFATVAETTEPGSSGMGYPPPGYPPNDPPPGEVTVVRSGHLDQAVTVQIAVGGSATVSTDYTLTPGASSGSVTVTFQPYETSKTISVTAVMDYLVDPEETIVFSISETSTYLVGSHDEAIVTIHDNHPTVTVYASDPIANEPDEFYYMQPPPYNTIDTGTFTVQRSGGDLWQPLTVNFNLGGRAAVNWDYNLVVQYEQMPGMWSVTFPSGVATATVTIQPIHDAMSEGTETVQLTLVSSGMYQLGEAYTDTVYIGDLGVPQFIVLATDPDATRSSPPPATDLGQFTIVRLGGYSPETGSISYFMQGTASANEYTLGSSAPVTIPSNTDRVTISVTPNMAAPNPGGDRTVILVLTGTTSNYSLPYSDLPTSATVTIHPEQILPPTVSISATDSQAAEPQTPGGAVDQGTFTLNRTGDLSSELTVGVTLGGTATNGLDYQQLSSNVVFAVGESTKILYLVPIADTNYGEIDETATLTINANSAYTIQGSSSATVTVLDAPGPIVEVTAIDDEATEPEEGVPEDNGVFQFTRIGGDLSQPLTVHFSVSGTATKGKDYNQTIQFPVSVTFDANVTSVTVQVIPEADFEIREDPESVIVTIQPDTAYDVGTVNEATITILNTVVGPRTDIVPYSLDSQDTCGCDCNPLPDFDGLDLGPFFVDYYQGNVSFNPFDMIETCGCGMPVLTYNSGENPHPIINLDVTLPDDEAVPDQIKVEVRLEGETQALQYFPVPSGALPGQTYRVSLMVDATEVSTGLVDYDLRVTTLWNGDNEEAAEYTEATSAVMVINNADSLFGNRWSMPGVGRMYHKTTGTAVGWAFARGDGTAAFYEEDAGQFQQSDGSYGTLAYAPEGGVTLHDLNLMVMQFDANGLLKSKTDRLGQTTQYHYDDVNGDFIFEELVSITNPAGQTMTFDYNPANDMLWHIHDFLGREYIFEYEGNRLTKITMPDPDGPGAEVAAEIEMEYNAVGLLTSVTDPVGNVSSILYGTEDRRFRSLSTGNNGPSAGMTPIAVAGFVIPVLVDDVHGTYSTPEGSVYEFQTDRFGHPTHLVDPAGKVTDIVRNDKGQAESIVETAPNANPSLLPQTTTYEYDAQGRLTLETLPDGRIRSWQYASADFTTPTEMTDEAGRTTTYTLDPNGTGNIVEEVNAAGYVTTRTYASDGRIKSESVPVITGTDTLERATTTYVYDSHWGPDRIIYADGSFKILHYDANGKLDRETGPMMSEEEENVPQTIYVRDSFDRILEMEEPDPDGPTGPLLPRVTTYKYDARGRLTDQSDSDGISIHLVYDASNRVTSFSVSYPEFEGSPAVTLSTSVVFNSAGQILSETNIEGNTTTYVYDAVGNLQRIEGFDPDGAGPGIADIWTYDYNAFGWLTSATDPKNRTTTYKYDDFGVLESETDYAGRKISYRHDEQGNIDQQTEEDPDGAGPLASRITGYHFNVLGQLDAENLPGGFTRSYTYTPTGDIKSVTWNDPDGAGELEAPVESREYDNRGNLTREVDSAGRETQYDYNHRGELETQIGPDGGETTYTYDVLGRIKTATDPLDHTTTYTYNSRGWVATATDYQGHVTTYGYDTLGRLTSITFPDPDGEGPRVATHITARYDIAGRLLDYNAGPNSEHYTYDGWGRIVTYSDALGRTVAYAYDVMSNVTSVTRPDGEEYNFVYNLDDNIQTATDPAGNVITLGYDEFGRNTSISQPGVGTQMFTYDAADHVVNSIDQLGRVTHYTYDQAGRIWQVTDALGGVTEYGYDAAGNVKSVTDPLGNSASVIYNELGQLTSRSIGAATESYTYRDLDGRLETYTDIFGQTTTYDYDDDEHTGTATAANGAVTTFVYDILGRITSVTLPDPDGEGPQVAATYQYEYDEWGQLKKVIDPLGGQQIYSYDAGGRLTSLSAGGLSTSYIYNWADQVTQVTSQGVQTQYHYNVLGQLDKITDALGRVEERHYNAAGRLDWVRDPAMATTSFTYDAVGNVLSVTDAEANVTSYTYDALNRPETETTTAGTRNYTYDAVGNVTSLVDRTGDRRTFDYEFKGGTYQVTSEKWFEGATQVREFVYSYDAVSGQILSASDPSSNYTYTYELGKLKTVSNAGTPDAPQLVLNYDYDLLGRLDSTSATVDGTADFFNSYKYDALNRVTRITQQGQAGGNAVADKRVDLGYTPAGLLNAIVRYDDLDGQLLVAETEAIFDNGRLTDLSHKQGTTNLGTYAWTYDAIGRLTGYANPEGGGTFEYDDQDQLTEVTHSGTDDEEYSYDLTGNRTLDGYITGPNNRLLSDGTFTYQYDAEGRRTLQTEIATGNTVEYSWDHRSRLTKLEFRNSTGTLTKQVAYTYDVFDRRIAKEVDANGDGTFESRTTFGYDGEDVVLTADETGSLTNRYLHGPGIDQIFADEQIGGDVLWALSDNLGTVTDWVKRDEVTGVTASVDHLSYDAYGNILSHTDPATGNPSTNDIYFAYTGREWDSDANLYFYRARWYDPHAGRFISEDPLGFAAGDVNVSRYVGNHSNLARDPSGLKEPQPTTQIPVNLDPRSDVILDRLARLQPILYQYLTQHNFGGIESYVDDMWLDGGIKSQPRKDQWGQQCWVINAPEGTTDWQIFKFIVERYKSTKHFREWQDANYKPAPDNGTIQPLPGTVEYQIMVNEQEKRRRKLLDDYLCTAGATEWERGCIAWTNWTNDHFGSGGTVETVLVAVASPYAVTKPTPEIRWGGEYPSGPARLSIFRCPEERNQPRPELAPLQSAGPCQTFATGSEWYEYFAQRYGAQNVEWESGSGRTITWPSQLPLPANAQMFHVRPPRRSSTFISELESVAGPRPTDGVGHHNQPLGLNGVDNGLTNGSWQFNPAHQDGHNVINRQVNPLPYGTEIRILPRPPGSN